MPTKPPKWDPLRVFALITTDPAGMPKAELLRRAGLGAAAYGDRLGTVLDHWRRKDAVELIKRPGKLAVWRRLMTPEQLEQVYRPRTSVRPRPERPAIEVKRVVKPIEYAKACWMVADLAALVADQVRRG